MTTKAIARKYPISAGCSEKAAASAQLLLLRQLLPPAAARHQSKRLQKKRQWRRKKKKKKSIIIEKRSASISMASGVSGKHQAARQQHGEESNVGINGNLDKFHRRTYTARTLACWRAASCPPTPLGAHHLLSACLTSAAPHAAAPRRAATPAALCPTSLLQRAAIPATACLLPIPLPHASCTAHYCHCVKRRSEKRNENI